MFGALRRVGLVIVIGCSTPTWAQQLSEGRAVISPVLKANVSAELSGVVQEVPFQPGSEFKRGDVLVRLDCRLFEAQARQANAEREIARIRAENASELAQRNSIGRVEAAVAAEEYKKRKAAAHVARLNADRCVIRAPFNGKVASLEVMPHERAEAGAPLLKIVGSDQFEVEIVAGSDWVGRVRRGDHISIEMDHSDDIVVASSRAFAPEMDPVSQTVTVYAQIEKAEDFLGGMTGTAIVMSDPKAAND